MGTMSVQEEGVGVAVGRGKTEARKEGERGEEVEGYPGLLLHHRFSTTYQMLPG